MTLRLALCVGVMTGLMGCSRAHTVDPPADLSNVEQEAYLVLMDQLLERISLPVDTAFCVGINTDDDQEGLQTSPAFVEHLRKGAASRFGAATFAPIAECAQATTSMALPDGRVAFVLYASDRDPNFPWQAGYSCGGLCGQGSFYDVDRTSGKPVAKHLGNYIN